MIVIYTLVVIWVAAAIVIIARGVCAMRRKNRAWRISITGTDPTTATLSYYDARERAHKSVTATVASQPK